MAESRREERSVRGNFFPREQKVNDISLRFCVPFLYSFVPLKFLFLFFSSPLFLLLRLLLFFGFTNGALVRRPAN